MSEKHMPGPKRKRPRRPQCKPCSACGNKPTLERFLDNNGNWFLYNCPICEPDGNPAQKTLREAVISWNKSQKRAALAGRKDG